MSDKYILVSWVVIVQGVVVGVTKTHSSYKYELRNPIPLTTTNLSHCQNYLLAHPRSTQPCIPLGWLNQIPAFLG